jgi:glyoxylase-like metal-dependent hydrolase (beta-lactamase superfamily II)|tara:strand:- start:3 stop:614 length:612 start_codon:yes stop_codon:yes gene_type:complete
MAQLTEIASGIFQWSVFSEEKKLNFNGLFVKTGDESIIIDPPELNSSGLIELKSLIDQYPTQAIILTNVHHERSSQALKSKFGIPIIINQKDASALDFKPDKTFKYGEIIFGFIKTISFENQKSPGETGLLIESQKIMILGDALIGKVPGKLNMLTAEKYEDIQNAKQSLKILNHYKFEILLLGDGESILNNAGEVVKKFLEE